MDRIFPELDFFHPFLFSIAQFISNIALLPQIYLILKTGKYRGISLGFILFHLAIAVHKMSYYNYTLEEKVFRYGGVFGLVAVIAYFWQSDIRYSRIAKAVGNKEKNDVHNTVVVENFEFVSPIRFDFSLIVVICTCVLTLVATWFYGKNSLGGSNVDLYAVLRLCAALSQFFHVRSRAVVDDLSLWTVSLLVASTIAGAIATLFHYEAVYLWTFIMEVYTGIINEFPSFIIFSLIVSIAFYHLFLVK